MSEFILTEGIAADTDYWTARLRCPDCTIEINQRVGPLRDPIRDDVRKLVIDDMRDVLTKEHDRLGCARHKELAAKGLYRPPKGP